MSERFVPIPGYEGIYEVSNIGRVKRVRGGPRVVVGRILRSHNSHRGYLRLMLWKDGAYKNFAVHRLVAMSFLGFPCGRQVNHKNGDKHDNHVENLEWVTGSQNQLHSYRVLRRKPSGGGATGEANGRSVLTRTQVVEIKQLLAGGHSRRALGCQFGVHRKTIGNIARGQTWKEVTL